MVPGGGCGCTRPVAVSRYSWLNQRLSGSVNVTSLIQPAATVAGLMMVWQTSEVVAAAVI